MIYKSISINPKFDQTDGRSTGTHAIDTATYGDKLGSRPTTGELMVQLNQDEAQTIPATRILDLALLILSTNAYFMEAAYKMDDLYDPDHLAIIKHALQGTGFEINVDANNETIAHDIQFFYDQLQSDGELYGERYRLLAGELRKLGY
ncbi:MAG: DUF6530 family protein [Furfurilactobacillus sp.]|jgi:hypothetical protein|uniref:DUF6530 family protein n=1 Tax=Furfurilactobacillus milii TaxID=2888272 RepID=A0ABT6DCY0_9LACO|nr:MULTISPECIES: DUF6530 family protein [Furfurilactobacillus]QLE65858.1 hypothetical protein LROSL2_0505 [Furfurilactobacillus rossiae]MCF6160234.1 DUF6530 family protein [Furfurilactobacillus milii]MCF6162177.1 DUF6530 family protein [Furfurilactobacillus milii]MCF6420498.1 DUF6530 family protein [Furfurilactobacillus milii]MCH4012378.1 DUF6530 family protein [Furfurilactobacillus sp.]